VQLLARFRQANEPSLVPLLHNCIRINIIVVGSVATSFVSRSI
jgi:hypothetical protein